MNGTPWLARAAAFVVVATLVGTVWLAADRGGSSPPVGPGASQGGTSPSAASPTPTSARPSPSPQPTTRPTPAPTPLALDSTYASSMYPYSIGYPSIAVAHPASAAWLDGTDLVDLPSVADRLSTADGLFGVQVLSTKLTRPMTADEWQTEFAAMPDSGVPTDLGGECADAAWSDVTIGGRPGRLFDHPCYRLFAVTTVGNRGYVFIAAVSTMENQGPWVPTFREMLASVEFLEEPAAAGSPAP